MEINFTEARQICASHQIQIRDLKLITGNFGKKIFAINQEFLLRVSETSMALEQEKFKRIAALNFVPKIIHTGILQRETGPIYYTLLTLLPGDDLVNVYPETTEAQQKQLGENVAGFLDDLQELTGTHYDIGLYVAALPCFSGTWREGHQEYWEHLRQESEKLPLKPDSIRVFERAYRFLQASIAVLGFQTGPRLLHNDFHLKNILLHQGKFSGVIDWECSQYGEADFELCHLIHWCLYPPESGLDFRPFLRALFKASPKCTRVPDLAQRLTLYQIEHELQQIIWNAGQAESWRVPRLVGWMDGRVDDLLGEIAI
ncbi:predicted aminoglycoside phosphotransferase [Longilinea arvoryzae]|uniref:Predicted aminoglycoside phosphotransferase n=1 Tax=Longilinea arvoryzae TaxID=360412 RepID=A0A0S7BC92_9CHLR|nr:aminoglycoside phosphotransferase family protein [Longilinea arvoryzae]GAP12777.1 predicted aminoglycoside phosphotransferase [Longilinea arvoryzae]